MPRLLHKSFRTEGSHLTDAFFSHLIIIGERKQNTNPCLKVLLGVHCHKCRLIFILLDGLTEEVVLHLPELPEQREAFVLQLRHHTVVKFIVRVAVFQTFRPTASVSSRSIKSQEIFQSEQCCPVCADHQFRIQALKRALVFIFQYQFSILDEDTFHDGTVVILMAQAQIGIELFLRITVGQGICELLVCFQQRVTTNNLYGINSLFHIRQRTE